MHLHQFLHILHLHVHRQHQPAEYLWHHLSAYQIVVMECPANVTVPTLRLSLTHVMQYRRPSQPKVVRMQTYILQHLQCMIEIILMLTTVLLLYNVECGKLRQYYLQQSAALQVFKTNAWVRSHNNLVQLVLYTLAAHNFYTVGHALQCIKRFLFYLKVKLCGKAYASHHAQRVVAKGNTRLQRCGNYTILKVSQPVKRIHQLTESCFVQTYCHGVDGKVTTILIVLQCTILYYRFARVVTVALFPGSNKLHFVFHAFLAEFYLCSTEVLKHRQVSLLSHQTFQFFGYLNSATYNYNIYVVRWAFQEYIPNVSPYNIALQPQTVCGLTYLVKYFLI